MFDKEVDTSWIFTKVQALRRTEWLGRAGERFRETLKRLSVKTAEQFNLEEAPEILKQRIANQLMGKDGDKYSQVQLNFATTEEKKIEVELKKKTQEDQVRQSHAIARKLEAEADSAEVQARIDRMREIGARIDLYKKLQLLDITIVPSTDGKTYYARTASTNTDWNVLRAEAELELAGLDKFVTLPKPVQTEGAAADFPPEIKAEQERDP